MNIAYSKYQENYYIDLKWWHSKCPIDMPLSEHLKNPTINCNTQSEIYRANQVAKTMSETAFGQGLLSGKTLSIKIDN